MKPKYMFLVGVFLIGLPHLAEAETIKVLTAGAFRQVLLSVVPEFQKAGHVVQMEYDTVGGLMKRIEGGENFDVVFASPVGLQTLSKAGKLSGEGVDLARVGVGVGVREGAPKPDISTVEGFKRALVAAKAVAYIDPASGGTSGIYLDGLLDKLGIGTQVKPKAVLVKGGYSADRVASDEAEIAVQQISEILPVKGVVLVGPLPAEIQSYTIYSAGVSAGSKQGPVAKALVDLIKSAEGSAIVKSKGMEPVGTK